MGFLIIGLLMAVVIHLIWEQIMRHRIDRTLDECIEKIEKSSKEGESFAEFRKQLNSRWSRASSKTQ